MPKPKFTKTLAIDFDGVIHDYKNPIQGKRMGVPIIGALAALDELYDKRNMLIIHTVKASTEGGKQAVEDWLDHYGFEYHKVTATKPRADWYIDDHGLRFTSWSETLDALRVGEEQG